MASFEKFKRDQVSHLFAHNYRISSPRDKHIDPLLTPFNYSFISRDINYLYQRLEDLNCSKRKDINVVAELVVTKPKPFSGSSDDFFRAVFDFVKLKYKEDNLIYASVHKDEPSAEEHAHFMFVPTVWDRKKKKAVVSYDKCVFQNLSRFHSELSNYLEKVFGYDVGVLNGATKNGNKTVEQLKKETELKQELCELFHEVEKAREEKENFLSLPDKIVVAELKKENDILRKQKSFLMEFLRQFDLLEKFKMWYENYKKKYLENYKNGIDR